MVTLTYLLKRPVAGDRGNALFTALEGNITQLDAHTHDGVTSSLLPGKSITGAVVLAPAGSWGSLTDGVYSQVVNLPAGYDFDKQQLATKLTSTKEYVYAKIEKVSASSFRIYCNDITVGFDILVGG